jgi:hypothetical protein
MVKDRTTVPAIALSPSEARFVTRPPIPMQTLRRALTNGELIAHRVGVHPFVLVSDLTQWLSAKPEYSNGRRRHQK